MNFSVAGADGERRFLPQDVRSQNPAHRDVDRGISPGYVRSVSHEVLDAISLEMGRRVAQRLREQPELIRVAQENLDRWTRLNSNAPSLLRCYSEWRAILNRPIEGICTILVSDDQASRRLRQNSPFAGVLNAREVWQLKRQLRHATASA